MLNHCSLVAVLIAVASTVHGQTTSNPLFDLFSRLDKSNVCYRHICYNGGFCTEVADIPLCTCQSGFYGNHCEFKEYADNSQCNGYCLNGGTCDYLEAINLAICSCPLGYTGNRCQKRDYWLDLPELPTSKPKPDINGFLAGVDTDIKYDFDTNFPDVDGFSPGNDINNDFDTNYSNDTEEYIEDTSSLWIVITSVIAAVILSMVYGMLHYMVRQRRRRRAILIRTIQVASQNATLHPPDTYISPGASRPRNFWTIATRNPRPVPCGAARIEQAAIPRQYESDSAPLVLSEEQPAMSNDYMYGPSQVTASGVTLDCIPPGAPPPYAQVAPEEGGHSINEAPPPYPGPQ